MCVQLCACTRSSEDNLWELVLSFYHRETGDWIQVIWLGSGYRHYLLSHLVQWGCVVGDGGTLL